MIPTPGSTRLRAPGCARPRAHAWVRLVLAAIAVWLWLGPCGRAHANPDVRWRTIETEHFFIHYWAGNEEAADRVAMIAEKAYRELSGAWGHDVFLKIHVILSDITDAPNGFANATPYPNIRLYTTAPESLSVLEAYDDWIDILVSHELTHVFHLDTVHGLYRAVNAVFGFGVLGKITTPNLLQPRWIIEGVATSNESQLSTRGRHRSAQFDAFLRMAVLEGSFQTLDQVSSSARVFPHGTSAYLYGLHFMQYIAARFGNHAIRDLSHIYATQVVPLGINQAIQKVTGVTYYQLWKEFKRDTERRFQAQARRIRSRGLRQGRRLTFSGEYTRYPSWSRDDEFIYFYKADGHREEGLKRLHAAGGRTREGLGLGRQGVDIDIEHVLDLEDESRAAFIGATEDMVFSLPVPYDYRYRWNDLYRWNGGDPKEAERLTFGLRATEPDVSADGKMVAFRRNDTAQSRLAFLDLDTAEVTEVAPQGRVSQVYSPRFHPDGRHVAFSGFREGGYRDIYVYDREQGTHERITADRFIDMSPSWSPDGRYLLFVSDRDDVYNIYAYDTETRRVHQVSNVLGGAYEPVVSHDGTRIAYIGFGKSAYDLWVMDFDPERWLEPSSTVTALPESEDPEPPIPGPPGRRPSLSSHRYRPGATFFPRTLFPSALDFQSSQFGTGLGFETGVADVVGFHTLSVSFNYDTHFKTATGSIGYRLTRLWPSFSVFAERDLVDRTGRFQRYLYDDPGGGATSYVVSGYRERFSRISATMGLPIVQHPRHTANVNVRYRWTRWENLDAKDVAIDPNAPVLELPVVGDATQLDLELNYSNESDGSAQFTYGVEQGRRIAVNVSVIDKRLGGDFDDLQVSGSYREIVPMPWRGHQSLLVELRGGGSVGDTLRPNPFCVGDFRRGGDVIRAMLARQGFGYACSALVRGYPVGVRRGDYFVAGTLQYRIPLLDVDRGIGTAPFLFRRIGLIPFLDVGNAWSNTIDVRDLLVGVGGTIVMSFAMGYRENVNLYLQYAHGFEDEIGVDAFRAIVATTF